MWTICVYFSLAFLVHANNAASIPVRSLAESAASNNPILDVMNWSLEKVENNERLIRQIQKLKNGASRFLGILKPDVAHQDCTTPGGKRGKCRHLQHCIFGEHRTFNVGLPLVPYVCIIDRKYVGVCCPVGNENPAPDPGGLPGSQDAGQLPAIDPGLPGSGPGDSTTPPPGFSTPTPIPGFHVRGCGVSMVKGARIVGGQPADPKEWPWMAALLRGKNEQFCGGVLITDQHVLTAAHCLMNKEAGDFMVRLGEYDLGMNSETRSQDFKIAEIIMHEEFSTSTYENDIAILKLQKKTAFNSYIWPICLPPPGPTYENRDAIVAGWGTVSYGGPASDVLMEVSVPVWNQTRCAKRYPQPILETMMCAGAYEGGKDSCQGDSGGPLMLQAASGRWSVIGVVSWGIRCAEPNTPGIYTRVNKYLQWIVEKSIF